jgi:hypothetical protein
MLPSTKAYTLVNDKHSARVGAILLVCIFTSTHKGHKPVNSSLMRFYDYIKMNMPNFKFSYLSVVLLLSYPALSQLNHMIDTSNYHAYISPKNLEGRNLTTDFLRLNDVIPIMIEELEKAGHEHIFDRVIYLPDNDQVIKVSV